MSRLSTLPALVTSFSMLTACGTKGEEEGTADYCGRLQSAVCNCEGGFGDDYEGDTCDEATARNAAAQQLKDNGDTEGYDNAQSTCQTDYEALPSECTGEDGGGEGEGEGEGEAACPDEVPEQYRNIWDCAAVSCPGGSILYHYATGESTAGDPEGFEVTEQWFMFSSSDWCTDTFEIVGERSPLDPSTFDCSSCETTWELAWNLTSGNQCSLMWGSVFHPDSTSAEGPFDGFMMLETHNSFGDRNPDGNMLVITAMIEGSTRQNNADYGRGYALPLDSEVDAPPESYEWVGELRSGCDRMVDGGPSDFVDLTFLDDERKVVAAP